MSSKKSNPLTDSLAGWNRRRFVKSLGLGFVALTAGRLLAACGVTNSIRDGEDESAVEGCDVMAFSCTVTQVYNGKTYSIQIGDPNSTDDRESEWHNHSLTLSDESLDSATWSIQGGSDSHDHFVDLLANKSAILNLNVGDAAVSVVSDEGVSGHIHTCLISVIA